MTKKEALETTNLDEEVIDAYLSIMGGEEYIDDIEEAYQGEYKNDEDFVQELLESIGEIPKDFPVYIHIDWESTARDVMMDYSEENGHYFRNL